MPESTLSDKLRPVEDALAPLTLAYLPGVEGVDLRLTAWDLAPDEARARLESASARPCADAMARLTLPTGEVRSTEVWGGEAQVRLASPKQPSALTLETCTQTLKS